MNRKAAKKRARRVVRTHYRLLFIVCLIAAFLGSEFTSSLDFFKAERREGTVSLAQGEEGPVIEMAGQEAAGAVIQVDEEGALGTPQVEQVRRLAGLVTTPGSVEDLYPVVREVYQNYFAPHLPGDGDSRVLGRSAGVLATLVNSLSSGSFLNTVIMTVYSVTHSGSVTVLVVIGLAFLLLFCFWLFVRQTYQVSLRRVALESLEYEYTPLRRLLWPMEGRKRWWRVARVLLLQTVYLLLWSLTIVGGIVKHYSYYLVPYLVAENPDLRPREAIRLSRDMMRGHKWQCFLWNMSFLGWDLLRWATLGLTGLFYSNAYKTCAMALYYTQRRQEAIEAKLPGAQLLCDPYLYRHAPQEMLDGVYGEIAQLRDRDMSDPITQGKGVRRFLAVHFGISLYSLRDEAIYDEKVALRQQLGSYEAILAGRSYPPRLHPAYTEKPAKAPSYHYLRHYSIPSLLLLFFLLAMVGWLWEVTLHVIQGGGLVNRGVLYGPWLPIYGAGSVMFLVLLNRFRGRIWLEFTLAAALAGVVEYATSWYLELAHGGVRWWDYSGYYLNLNGRICAEGLLLFGMGGLAVVYVVAPRVDSVLRRIKARWKVPVVVALSALFILDMVYSHYHPNMGPGVTSESGAITEQTEARRDT